MIKYACELYNYTGYGETLDKAFEQANEYRGYTIDNIEECNFYEINYIDVEYKVVRLISKKKI